MLNDVELLRDMPRIFRDNLLTITEDLFRRGVIDALERFDMDEMAEAAYMHEVEELQILHRYFLHAGCYSLVLDGVQMGELRSVRVYFGAGTRELRPADYDARIERTANGLEVIHKHKREPIGHIDGKRYIAKTGEKYELVETSRVIGTEHPAIDDPDVYRGLLDAIQHAVEQGDSARQATLAKRANVSIFMPCPACEDQFSRREDCQECDGRGFVTETPERFRWRS